MRVEWAILCRHAEPLPDRSFVMVGAPTDVVLASSLPYEVRLAVVFKVMFTVHEADQRRALSVTVLDPELSPVFGPVSRSIITTRSSVAPAGWDGEHVYFLRLEFAAATPGTYSVEVTAEDSASYSVPLLVAPTPPEGMST